MKGHELLEKISSLFASENIEESVESTEEKLEETIESTEEKFEETIESTETEDIIDVPKETKFEITEEMFMELSQTVADLILRVETLEPEPESKTEDVESPEDLEKINLEKINLELQTKIEKLESTLPATERVTGTEKTEDNKVLSEFDKWKKLTQK